MITIEQFRIATELMFQSHSQFRPSDRLRALYHFFKHESEESIRKASEEVSRTHTKFPSIPEFGSTISKFKRTIQESSECDYCLGMGLLSVIDNRDNTSFTYRCQCINASKYQKLPTWFGTYHPDRVLAKVKMSEPIPGYTPPKRRLIEDLIEPDIGSSWWDT